MSIQLVTYANQTVTPTNDAIIYEKAVDQNGIFYGCNVTVTSNTVNITGGYGLVCGREFVVNSESITVTLAPSGTLQGRLYVRLDLADADAPIQLLTVTGNTLPALTQDDDVNYTNGVYEMELATFTVGVSALSDVVETFETIVGNKSYIPSEIAAYVVAKGTDGLWDYTKWSDGTYEAVYVGNVNMQTGSAMAGGYFHQTSSALAPPSFSSSVVSVHGAANSANLYAYVGHANDYSTYWWNSAAAALNNVPVRIMMYGTW